jgi:hypothetical protein
MEEKSCRPGLMYSDKAVFRIKILRCDAVSLGEWILTFLRHYKPSECWELPTQKFQSTTLLLQCQISEGNIYFI